MSTPPSKDLPANPEGYEILECLGEGGRGTVYLARREDRRVVVKFLKPIGAADAMARLEEDLAAAKWVDAEDIARVLDYGRQGAQPYVVSEYVDGRTLAAMVTSGGPISGKGLDLIATGTLRALAAIHDADLVHGGLTPQNILLGGDGARITDFALGGVPGTSVPGFRSPQQLAGEPYGPATDMFAWAAGVVFAATGRTPFGDGSPAELIQRISGGVANVGPLPGGLREVVIACLARSAAERYTASDALRRLSGEIATVQSISGTAVPVPAPAAPASAPGVSLPAWAAPSLPDKVAPGGQSEGALVPAAAGSPTPPSKVISGESASEGTGRGPGRLPMGLYAGMAAAVVVAGVALAGAVTFVNDQGAPETRTAQAQGAEGALPNDNQVPLPDGTPTWNTDPDPVNIPSDQDAPPKDRPITDVPNNPNPRSSDKGRNPGREKPSPSPTKRRSPSPSPSPTKPKPSPSPKPKPTPTQQKYTAVQACNGDAPGSGYYVQRSTSFSGGTVYQLYSKSSTYNCVVTLKSKKVGTRSGTTARLYVQNGTGDTDSGNYAWYAVAYAKAPGKCVKYSGSVSGFGTSSSVGWANCG